MATVDNIDVIIDTEGDSTLYEKWYRDLAIQNLNHVKNKTAAKQHKCNKELGIWHIPTAIIVYPKLSASILRLFPNRTFESGIDIGCGTVTLFDYIQVSNPLLIDLVEEYCIFMRNKGHRVRKGNIENLNFIEDASMDIVICSDILEPVFSFRTALNEVKRILKPDGLLVGNIPWEQKLHKSDRISNFSHVRTFNNSNLSTRFSDWTIIDKVIISDTEARRQGCLTLRSLNFIMTKKVGL